LILDKTVSGRTGMSLLYTFTLDDEGVATVSKVRLNPQTKALAEGQTAGLAFLTQGSDLIAGSGMKAAVSGANAAHGLSAFAAVSGGRSRYDTGSHVDVSGVSLMAGLAFGTDLNPGRLTLGAFFEGGWGSYDSYNSFRSAASVDGDGDTSYVGGGILGRFDSRPLGPGKAYVEASARMGASDTDFSSTDLSDGFGKHARYDLETTYYGLHTGAGYVWQITEAAALDLSGKYFWTRQGSDSMHIAGDPVKFKATDSHRLRAGGRLTLAVTEHVSPYIGAAYEHELDGEADARVYGHRISSPDLSGPTGIGEIGLALLGGEQAPLSLDLGVQGYTGTREGVTGSLRMKLEF
jgi:outer membrane autotransporter protein